MLNHSADDIFIGTKDAVVAGLSAAGNNNQGTAYQAQHSFTANRMFIRGSNAASYTCDFILCVYNATDLTTWSGSLAGYTVPAAALNQDQLLELALVAPINFVLNNWYALTILPDAPGLSTGGRVAIAGGDRFFGDTYAGGPADPASASALNNAGGERCMWAQA